MAVSKRKFYRSLVQIEILSEEPIAEDMNAEEIHYVITFGECSGQVSNLLCNEEIDAQKAAKLLQQQGSDPEFFELTSEGEDITGENNGNDQ